MKKIIQYFSNRKNKVKTPERKDLNSYIKNRKLSDIQKQNIDNAVKKVVKDYQKTLKMLEFN